MATHKIKFLATVTFLASLISMPAANVLAGDRWQMQKLDTEASLRGLSVVGRVVWASGTGGTFVKTTNGGETWSVGHVAGAEKLDFRDVEAFSAQVAYLLSIGPGGNSCIYKTNNGGDSWTLQFQNAEPEAFFDALAFWDEGHGLAMSDPIRGRFYLVKTDDGGAHWIPVAAAGLPPAVTGEGGFAASGTCLITRGQREAWLVSGGTAARVYHSTNRGRTWTVVDTPIINGPASAGIFSIAFAGGKYGLIVGGDYQKPQAADKNIARTMDGGRSWELMTQAPPGGFRSSVAFVSGADWKKVLTVGTSGTDLSRDGGLTWEKLDQEDFNAVAFAARGSAWAVGPKGRLAKMVFGSDRWPAVR